MISKEEFLAAGYKLLPAPNEYPYRYPLTQELCNGYWHKPIIENDRLLYYINVYEWNFPGEPIYHSSAKILFTNSGFMFKLELEKVNNTIEEVESFFLKIFKSMDCK
jgi:hypothetical protein